MHANPRILWLDLGRERDNTLRRAVIDNFEDFREISATPCQNHVEQSPNTVIVCHVDLPSGSDLELLRRYRFAYPYVPMIAIVADRSYDLLRWFLQMRVWDVVFKPCSGAHLLHCLQEANHPDPLMKFALPRDAAPPVLPQAARDPTTPRRARRDSKHKNATSDRDPKPLTPSETRVLTLLRAGHNGKEIAKLLKISYETVRKHQKNIYRKLGVKSALQAVLCAGRTF